MSVATAASAAQGAELWLAWEAFSNSDAFLVRRFFGFLEIFFAKLVSLIQFAFL